MTTASSGGVEVYPRLVAAEHLVAFQPTQLKSGIPALDTLLGEVSTAAPAPSCSVPLAAENPPSLSATRSRRSNAETLQRCLPSMKPWRLS